MNWFDTPDLSVCYFEGKTYTVMQTSPHKWCCFERHALTFETVEIQAYSTAQEAKDQLEKKLTIQWNDYPFASMAIIKGWTVCCMVALNTDTWSAFAMKFGFPRLTDSGTSREQIKDQIIEAINKKEAQC